MSKFPDLIHLTQATLLCICFQMVMSRLSYQVIVQFAKYRDLLAITAKQEAI